MKIFNVTENPYRYLYMDLTHRCNMSCKVCCNPDRDTPDMTLEYFEDVCKTLPKKVIFRVIGGEPTVHPQFFDFIRIANEYKHIITICTNGKKLSDYSYAKELKNVKADFPKRFGDPFAIILDMSGGLTNNHYYETIHGAPCAQMKMGALTNMLDLDFKRIAITAIIMRDFNESVIPELLLLADNNKNIKTVHFRNMAKIGRWVDTDPYTVPELKELLIKYMGRSAVENPRKIWKGVKAPEGKECNECCYQFQKDLDTQIGLIEFAGENSAKCWYRGQLLPDFKIVPMFEYMRSKDATP